MRVIDWQIEQQSGLSPHVTLALDTELSDHPQEPKGTIRVFRKNDKYRVKLTLSSAVATGVVNAPSQVVEWRGDYKKVREDAIERAKPAFEMTEDERLKYFGKPLSQMTEEERKQSAELNR